MLALSATDPPPEDPLTNPLAAASAASAFLNAVSAAAEASPALAVTPSAVLTAEAAAAGVGTLDT